ncbi:amidase signature domain-containing protein [Nemania sp. FL0031]|nr:amidase signature domain-containing protein [Nemania sp. FL0031]
MALPPPGRLTNPLVYSVTQNSHFLIETHDLQTDQLKLLKNLASETKDTPELDFSPAAVIRWSSTSDENYLARQIEYFLKDGDFERSFLQTIVLAYELGESPLLSLSEGVASLLKRLNCREVMSLSQGAQIITEGPYFVQGRQLRRTWKLFPDTYEAFQLPTIQLPNTDEFRPFTYVHEGNLMIPVPSKLHFPQTAEKPFNGLRVTVKDIIHLKGVKTTAQSRSFEKTYPASSVNAKIVSQLIKLGAVFIGKTKCTQFASSDQPTADWVDYHCPWNPRGDGYLSPRGSSTGTCVALAGYDWVDLGLGSDTGGSIRGPAAVMGLFALRPSQENASMEGILPIISGIDTPGIACRDIALMHKVSKALFKSPDQTLPAREEIANEAPDDDGRMDFRLPKKLLYPSDYWNSWISNPQSDILESFVRKLERFLGIERTPVNLAEKWINESPAGSYQTPIEDYLRDTFMNLLWRGYHHEHRTFRDDYKNKFGNPPYVHPVVQDCWDRGSKISSEEVRLAKQHQAVYQKWLRESVLDGEDFGTVMIFPAGDLTPFYRDVYSNAPDQRNQSYNWNDRGDHQSSLGGVPNIVIPVGQAQQPSKVTKDLQELPVAVHVISSNGTDDALTKLFKCMAEESMIKGVVNTGPTAFDSIM